jgi:hypothetical protein
MGKIFLNQTKLTIRLNVEDDMAGVASAKIKYRKPNGATGDFVAVIDSPSREIYYNVNATTDLDIEGRWFFWAFLTYSDGKTLAGEVDAIKILMQGKL